MYVHPLAFSDSIASRLESEHTSREYGVLSYACSKVRAVQGAIACRCG